jgi:hypothetical protein
MRLCLKGRGLKPRRQLRQMNFRLYRWLKNSLQRRQRCPAAEAEIDFARLTTRLEAASFENVTRS